LTGNSGTNSSTNFIGTTDNVGLNFRTNNVNSLTISPLGVITASRVPTDAEYSAIGSGANYKFLLNSQDNTTTTTNLTEIIGLTGGTSKRGSGSLINNRYIAGTAAETSTSSGSIINLEGVFSHTSKEGSGAVTNMSGFTALQEGAASASGSIATMNAFYGNVLQRGSASINIVQMNGSRMDLAPSINGGATIGTANGYLSNFNWATTAPTTSFSGFNSNFSTSTAVNVNSMFAFRSNGINSTTVTNGGSSITNAYGLFLGDVNRGSTLNYGIYTSAGLNSFGDNIEQRGTGYLKLATGTTAQRPSTATAGMTRFNSSLTALEYFDGTAWNSVATSSSPSNIYTANGTLSGNRTVTQGANTLAFTSTATNGFSVDGSTFSVDAANNRIGIGNIAPTNTLHVTGTARIETMASGASTDSVVTVDATGVLKKRALSSLAVSNIYNSNGTLSGNRTVQGGGNSLTFDNVSLIRNTSNGIALELFNTVNDAYISNVSNKGLILRTNNIDRLNITNDGDIGVGTASPLSKLHIVSNSTAGLKISPSSDRTDGIRLYLNAINNATGIIENVWDATGTILYRNLSLNPSGGNVGLGTTTPESTLQTNGTFALNTATSGTANSVVLLATGTFTPPTASTVSGRIYIIRNTSAATNVTVASLIDYGATSAASFTLTPAIGSVMIISDGTSWFRIQ
jgi:hypothetical protein